ncbi:hypothetical protein [Clostridium nigeriense]|nr:hypothetical protein [Clostridium nigeriense]
MKENIVSLERFWSKIEKMMKKTAIKVKINSKKLAKNIDNELKF